MNSSPADTLSTFYDGWEAYQNRLIAAITPLTPDQLALRPASGLRTIEQMARHILAARARWLHWILGEGGAEIDALTAWDTADPADTDARTPEELLGGLHTTWHLIHASLARWTPAALAENVTGTWGDQTFAVSRQWVIWHLLEHDLRHGGELSLTLGMHGLTDSDL